VFVPGDQVHAPNGAVGEIFFEVAEARDGLALREVFATTQFGVTKNGCAVAECGIPIWWNLQPLAITAGGSQPRLLALGNGSFSVNLRKAKRKQDDVQKTPRRTRDLDSHTASTAN
jgi:hypothetical protein